MLAKWTDMMAGGHYARLLCLTLLETSEFWKTAGTGHGDTCEESPNQERAAQVSRKLATLPTEAPHMCGFGREDWVGGASASGLYVNPNLWENHLCRANNPT